MAARTAGVLIGLLTSLAVPGFASASSGHDVRATTDVRYREQLLQQTPISLRLFTATEIEERVLRRSDGIGQSTANLNFQTATGSSFDARILIRGIGQADPNDLFEPAVGVFLDGVYLPRASTTLFPLFDIERIEVLRGPQGALFGKNTVGGAIALRTVRPGREYGGKIELLYGNLGQLETRVSADIPVRLGAFRDKLFTRLSFASATNDGYVTHSPATFAAHRRQQNPMAYVGDLEGPDETTGDDKLLATRMAVQALPSDDLTIDFTFDWAREPKRQRIGACSRPDPFNAGGLVVESFAGPA